MLPHALSGVHCGRLGCSYNVIQNEVLSAKQRKALQSIEKPIGYAPQAAEKFSVQPFSKGWQGSRGQRPLVAHRSERNLLKAVAFFRGESKKQSGGLFF